MTKQKHHKGVHQGGASTSSRPRTKRLLGAKRGFNLRRGLIALILIGVLLIGGLFVFYGRGEGEISIIDSLFSRLKGITPRDDPAGPLVFATIIHTDSGDWTGKIRRFGL